MTKVMEMTMVMVMCVRGHEWGTYARASAHAHACVHEEASERPRRLIVQQSLKVDEWACNINPCLHIESGANGALLHWLRMA